MSGSVVRAFAPVTVPLGAVMFLVESADPVSGLTSNNLFWNGLTPHTREPMTARPRVSSGRVPGKAALSTPEEVSVWIRELIVEKRNESSG